MACCPRASSFVRHTEGRGLAQEHLTVSALSAPCDGSPMTVRGGGVPAETTALMPLSRMGPPPRSLLPMRIPASWSGSLARRIQGCGTMLRAPTRNPPRTSSSRPPQVCRRARSHQGQGPYGRRYTRHPCPLLRAPASRSSGSGRRNGLPRSNKETEERKKWIGPLGHPLDKIRPIQG